jgi:photosystem II stability/assembly factor-like uncharacterized protein
MKAVHHMLAVAIFIAAFPLSALLLPPAPSGSPAGGTAALDDAPRKGPDLERWYFRRWNEGDNVIPPERLAAMWDEVQRVPDESRFGPNAVNPWTVVGPLGMVTSGSNKYSGRILDVEAENGAGVRIGAASGGVWGFSGSTPLPMSDRVSSLAIATLATDPTNPNRILIGTGEPYQRGGTGMFVTTNAGATWTQVPLSPNPSGFFRIRFSPGNPSVVHATSSSGYYRSTNGGAAWTRTLSGYTTDLAINPVNPQILFTSVWGTGMQRSTDGGATWRGLAGGGLPASNVGRTAITLANSSPSTVYISIARDDNDQMLGVYKTTQATVDTPAWTNVSPSSNFMGSQGWYDNIIGVSPTNPDVVLVGGVSAYRTTNGGTSWSSVSGPHVDHHAIEWASNGTEVWNGNDGGLFYSSDAGASWNSVANTMPITQYVNIDVDPNDNLTYAGGSQDNGISRTTDAGASWNFMLGGDGGGIAFDVSTAPADAGRWWITNGVYGGSWAFQRLRTTTNGSGFSGVNTGVDASSQWYHKIRTDRVAPVTIYNHSGTFVYQSTDFGTNWTKLNSAFPAEVADVRVSARTTGGAVVYAVISSSTAGQKLRVYDNGTWYERSTGLGTGSVRSVTPHPGTGSATAGVAYALMNGSTAGQKIYRTTDRGVTWTNISGNLPNVAMGDAMVHPTNGNLIVVGSQMGCYRTTDGGTSWHRWNNGMPEATIVTELKWLDSTAINGRFYVVAGTYGRGIFRREITDTDATSVGETEGVPSELALEQNYPNPFNPATTIRFALPSAGRVVLKVYDMQGRESATLVDGVKEAGAHQAVFDASGLASGVYLYRLTTPEGSVAKKLTLVR